MIIDSCDQRKLPNLLYRPMAKTSIDVISVGLGMGTQQFSGSLQNKKRRTAMKIARTRTFTVI